jgi:hypothetical protein
VPHSWQNFDSTRILHLGQTTGAEPQFPQNLAEFCVPHAQVQLSSFAAFLSFFPNKPPLLLLPPVKLFTFLFVWFKLFVVRLNVLMLLLILSNGIFFGPLANYFFTAICA